MQGIVHPQRMWSGRAGLAPAESAPPRRSCHHRGVAAATVSKVERLLNVVAMLLDSPQPVPLVTIVHEVPGYPPAFPSARVQFERDKSDLRAEGIEVVTSGEGAEARYWIDPARHYLPDLGLDEEEAVALNVAASAVRFEGDDPDEALLKVGAAGADGPALVALPADPRLPALYEAVRARRLLSFAYDGVDRAFEPYGLLCRDAFWYLVGHDRTRDAPRSFRVDRIAGAIEPGDAAAFDVPASYDPARALPEQPYALAPGEAVEATIEVDRVMASRVVREVGEAAVRERRTDGTVVVAIPVLNPAGLRSWLFGFLDHARVLDPPELVEVVTGWLEAMAGEGT